MGRGISTKPQPQTQVDAPLVELPPAPPVESTGVQAPAPENPPEQPAAKTSEPRMRKNGAGPACPSCKGTDTFVQSGGPRAHPKFVEVRFRHYRCGRCDHRFKIPK